MKDDDRRVTVCAECLQASCFQGEFYCDKARTAGVTRRSVRELRELALEHQSYWAADRIARIEGRA